MNAGEAITKMIRPKRALIVVDNLECFHPGGALAVPEAGRINPIINDLHAMSDFTVAVQEWHPEDHKSFNTTVVNQELIDIAAVEGTEFPKPEYGPWPPHGIANQGGPSGSNFHPDMDMDEMLVFRKGKDKDVESYSAFSNEKGEATRLAVILRGAGIKEVWICGLATEYCVLQTALDAKKYGFKTVVWLNGVAGIDYDASEAALSEMSKHGVELRKHYIQEEN